MNILDAIEAPELFQPFFGDLSTWKAWGAALRALYGLPITSPKAKELVKSCTGRDASELPEEGFQSGIFLVGRRGGKSRAASTIAAYEALFVGHETKLAKGEQGMIACIAPTKLQAGIIWDALHGIFSTPLLKQELVETRQQEKCLVLRNGLQIKILVGDWRTVRGFTLCCVIVDEVCFLQYSDDFKIRSDTELIRAISPGLSTLGGRLICISSPYARRGWAYQQWIKNHGSNRGVSPSFQERWSTLVWQASSRSMNPKLSQSIIDAALLEDPSAARSEYFAEWRDDISQYIERSLIEALVIKGRKELMPRPNVSYFAFSDLSGGRSDSAAVAIAHRENRKVILDFLRIWKAPHNPHVVIGEQADELKRFGLRRVTGDAFGAEFVAQAFQSVGIHYVKSDQNKSELYRELLPRLCSAEIELLDSEILIDQLAGLERRTVSGGADKIDHPPGGKDDAANAVAGVAVCASTRARVIGPLFKQDDRSRIGALALGA